MCALRRCERRARKTLQAMPRLLRKERGRVAGTGKSAWSIAKICKSIRLWRRRGGFEGAKVYEGEKREAS